MSKAQLERGYRLVELLKQPLNSPMPVEEQVVSIYAGTNGYLDDVPVGDVRRFEDELLEAFRTRVRRPARPHPHRRRRCPTASLEAVADVQGRLPGRRRRRAGRRSTPPRSTPRASHDATSDKTLATE